MGDNGANHTGKVAGSKGDSQLGALAIALLGRGEDVRVEGLHDLLEEEEFGHGVGDLSGPEGHQGAEGELGVDLVSAHCGQRGEELGGEGTLGGGLDLNLDHLQGAEGGVGEDLGGGGAGQINDPTVGVGGLLTGDVGVEVFEEFVQAELKAALQRVADSCGQPSLPDAGGALLGHDELDGGEQTLKLLGSHLHVALRHVQGRHGQVGQAAGKHAAQAALQVVVSRVGHGVLVTRIPRPLSHRGSHNLLLCSAARHRELRAGGQEDGLGGHQGGEPRREAGSNHAEEEEDDLCGGQNGRERRGRVSARCEEGDLGWWLASGVRVRGRGMYVQKGTKWGGRVCVRGHTRRLHPHEMDGSRFTCVKCGKEAKEHWHISPSMLRARNKPMCIGSETDGQRRSAKARGKRAILNRLALADDEHYPKVSERCLSYSANNQLQENAHGTFSFVSCMVLPCVVATTVAFPSRYWQNQEEGPFCPYSRQVSPLVPRLTPAFLLTDSTAHLGSPQQQQDPPFCFLLRHAGQHNKHE